MVTYREYIKEIESFTEQNMLDQVISHSDYILKSYPNSIEALRFLGQAYLEEKKFAEAVNCFEKVLSFAPDDFVAHVGMSAIKEEERDIDAAIYHMEIAFDTQPSNVIVQEELKRLIKKRDGTSPQKISLTRGALIRMYMKGDLFQQALNEIETTLAENPNRIDLRVLQAIVLAQSNAKVQAAEVCNQILTQLPYCLEPNKLLLQIYLENGLSEQAAFVQERLISLDPYFKFVNSSNINVEDVPDSKVELEKLEYTSAFSSENQVFWSPPETEVNDNNGRTQYPERKDSVSEVSVPSKESNDVIPEFMMDAGWSKSENPQSESPEPIAYSPDSLPDTPVQSDLPEWLKNYQPTSDYSSDKVTTYPGISEPLGIIIESEPKEETVTNINPIPVENLSSISEVEMTTDNPQIPSPNDESSDWMSQFFDEANKSSSEPEEDKGLPEWLKTFGQEEVQAETNAEDDVPDWLKNLDSQIVQNDAPGETVENNPESPTENGFSDEISNDKSPFSIESETVESEISSPTQEIPSIEPTPSEDDFLNSLSSLTSDVQNPETLQPAFIQDEPSVDAPTTSENVESVLPDWVKSVLSEPDDLKTDLPPLVESPTGESLETSNVPSDNSASSIPEDSSPEVSEGAISDDAGEELLKWLREINPEQPEPVSPNEYENIMTPDTSSHSDVLDESLNRLEEISVNVPESVSELSTETVNFEDLPLSISADEMIPTGDLSSTTEPVEQADIIEEMVSENKQEPTPQPTLLETLQAHLLSSNYTEANASISGLTSTGIKADEIVEVITAFAKDKTDDFEYFQFLGDTLAGFDRFDEAMDMYPKAEDILTGK